MRFYNLETQTNKIDWNVQIGVLEKFKFERLDELVAFSFTTKLL